MTGYLIVSVIVAVSLALCAVMVRTTVVVVERADRGVMS